MDKEFAQIHWDSETADDCRQLIRLAVREDLRRSQDLTTVALIPADANGAASVVARSDCTLAGLPAVELLLAEMNLECSLQLACEDGVAVESGTTVASILGNTRDILTGERIILNLLGRLSGIASLTRLYVDEVAGTKARIYDTRKTTPGWRRLEKYAVRCGGGTNHRSGLFDAVLIKDNHLAHAGLSPAESVRNARRFLETAASELGINDSTIVEVEVDTLKQLEDSLTAAPDLVLVDNMSPAELTEAIRIRDRVNSNTELEASGGINLQTVRSVAETGVERISVGALTHSAVSVDLGLDWHVS